MATRSGEVATMDGGGAPRGRARERSAGRPPVASALRYLCEGRVSVNRLALGLRQDWKRYRRAKRAFQGFALGRKCKVGQFKGLLLQRRRRACQAWPISLGDSTARSGTCVWDLVQGEGLCEAVCSTAVGPTPGFGANRVGRH